MTELNHNPTALATLPPDLERHLENPQILQALGLPEDLAQDLRAWGIFVQPRETGYFMLRLRLDLGSLSQTQWQVLSAICADFGQQMADLTSRGGLALRWIHATRLKETVLRLAGVNLIARGAGGPGVRSISGCALSGVDLEAEGDIEALVLQMRQRADEFWSKMPGSLKIGVYGRRDACCCDSGSDIDFSVAQSVDADSTESGLRLWIGGAETGIWCGFDQAADVLEAVLVYWIEQAAEENGQSFKAVIKARGLDALRSHLQQRFENQLKPALLLPEDFQATRQDHIGVFAQSSAGLYSVGVPVPVGRLNAVQMKKIGDMAKRYGEDIAFRVSNSQNLMILNVPEAHLPKLLSGLKEIDLSVNAGPVRRGWMSCTGLEFCAIAKTETRSRGKHFLEHLDARVRLERPISIRMEGCDKGCLRGGVADIRLVGSRRDIDGRSAECYTVWIQDRPVAEALGVSECLKRLEELLQRYQKKAKPGESFGDWSARMSEKKLASFLTQEAAHPMESAD